MKKAAFVVLLLAGALSGCFDDTEDIQKFMAEVKANTSTGIAALPPVKDFEHLPYSSSELRSPFSLPSVQTFNQAPVQQPGCFQPDQQREKQPLEHYALDNLTMRGTVGHAKQLWALIEAADHSVHRITVNDRLGLFYGKVIAVRPDYIEVTEFIPDGSGCTVRRNSKLQLLDAAAESTEIH
jgi:type IV pilus assembly protein PilP